MILIDDYGESGRVRVGQSWWLRRGVVVVAARENIRIKRAPVMLFVQLGSKWSHGRELAIGWSDGAGDMAGERQGDKGSVWETQEPDQNLLLGKWASMVDCGGREKVGKSKRGGKGGQSAV